jgi:hypothetical protein
MDQLDSTSGPQLDALARFLRFATDQPLSSPASLLTEALGKTLFPCDVVVHWRIYRRGRLLEESSFQWACAARKVRKLEQAEPSGLIWTEAKRPTETYKLEQAFSDDRQGTRIAKAGPVWGARTELEMVFVRADSAFPGGKIERFRRDIVGITMIFQAFSSLAAPRLAPPQRTNRDDFRDWLKEAAGDLDRLRAFPGTGDPQEQLVEAVLLEMFGLGWDVHNLSGEKGDHALSDFERRIAGTPKLRALRSILAASRGLKPRTQKRSPSSSGNELQLLDMISRWTCLHARAREILKLGASQKSWSVRESEDLEEIGKCWSELAKMLFAQTPRKPEPVETSTLSSRLKLWFCMTLWQHLGTDTAKLRRMTDAARWQLYADLTYVVRESLRGMLYGGRAEFRFQPVVFATALCTLVEQHAVRILELPQALELRGILREIGRISLGGGPLFAAGHLQHVLEMYITGFFLSEVRLKNVEAAGLAKEFEGASICEVLAGGGAWLPGLGKQLEFQKAFALAVLLHDIGTLLFPFWPHRAEGLAEVDGGLIKQLTAIRGALNGSLELLLALCERELIEVGIFDPVKEPKIREWIEECIEQGQADHSVLGAWYLIHGARRAAGLPSSVVRQAARAVLLHGIHTQEIRTDEDPAAALLVLCDELIVWRAGHELPQANAVGRYFHSIAGELKPEESIFLTIEMPGLMVSLDKAAKSFSCSLDLAQNLGHGASGADKAGRPAPPADGEERTWPRIEIDLRKPDRLPMPVFKFWLLAGQNLGRIEPSKGNWGPVLRVSSQIPLRQPPLSTRELLVRVARRAGLSLRPCLERWLDHYKEAQQDSYVEIATFGPAPPFCERRLSPLFSELERLIEAVLHEEELRSQMPEKSPQPRNASRLRK